MPVPVGFTQHSSGFWMKSSDSSGPYTWDGTTTSLALSAAVYPLGSTVTSSSSGNVAAAAATSTLAGVASKTTYITGFWVTGGGATLGSIVSVTVTGTIGGTMTFALAVTAGILLANNTLFVNFPVPIPASAVNTSIIVSVPSLGAGNTNSSVVATGFVL